MAPSPSNHGLPHDSSPSASSSTAAADAQSPTQNAPQEQSSKELELQRKRARDRKSQQAMRDRNKWTIHTLTEQVGILSTALDQRARDLAALEAQIGFLKAENTQLRTQNAVLQRHMADRNDDDGDASASRTGHSPGSSGGLPSPPWKLVPKNTPPSCLTDQIVQGFVDTIRAAGALTPSWPRENTKVFPLKPNLCSLLDETHRSDDGISNVVADIIRTYPEIISGLPRQVGVFYLITTFLKWLVLLDKQSWDLMPEWLRPIPSQLSTSHSAWIDRIPWPRVREYLIAHPEITLDNFAAFYSSGFRINWPYDPGSVLLAASVNGNGAGELTINPVYEEHLRQIRNWGVADTFRQKFPELTQLIDAYSR